MLYVYLAQNDDTINIVSATRLNGLYSDLLNSLDIDVSMRYKKWNYSYIITNYTLILYHVHINIIDIIL